MIYASNFISDNFNARHLYHGSMSLFGQNCAQTKSFIRSQRRSYTHTHKEMNGKCKEIEKYHIMHERREKKNTEKLFPFCQFQSLDCRHSQKYVCVFFFHLSLQRCISFSALAAMQNIYRNNVIESSRLLNKIEQTTMVVSLFLLCVSDARFE